MNFVEKARIVERMHYYFRIHPTTATREGFELYSGMSFPRHTFGNYVELVRQVYRCSIIYNDSTKTYITDKQTPKQIRPIPSTTPKVRKPPKSGYAVICVETQQQWESIKQCANEIGVSGSYLSECMRFRDAICGKHYNKM